MKNSLALIFFVIILLFFPGCDKKEIRLDNFFVEFATVINKDSSLKFQLDNDNVLNPQNTPTIELKNGNRVIISYTPLDKGLIKLNSVRPIFLDTIKEEGYSDKVKTSPIKIISVWVSGMYLNMSFYVDYHSKPHITGLFRDMEATIPTLYFSYNRGEDPPGAPTLTYLSFNLESLPKRVFTIQINTYQGVRDFTFLKN